MLDSHTGILSLTSVWMFILPFYLICKFNFSKFEVLSNMYFVFQAQHNTRMLATYAAIDPRVQYLGYTMKVFAKVFVIHFVIILMILR